MNWTKLAILVASTLFSCAGFAASVVLQNGTATVSQGSFSPDEAIDGDFGDGGGFNGWATLSQPGIAVWETATDVGESSGTRFKFNFYQQYLWIAGHNMRNFRLSYTTDDRSLFADGLDVGGDVTANWVEIDADLTRTFIGVVGGDATISTTNGPDTLTQQGDLSFLASGPNPNATIYTIATNLFVDDITGFRLEMLTPPGRFSNGNFVLSELTVETTVVPIPPAAILLGSVMFGLLRRRR